MSRDVACVHCGATLTPEDVRGGWCEGCGKPVPRGAAESWPDAGSVTPARRASVPRGPLTGGQKVVAGLVATRLWGFCCPGCGSDRLFADGPGSMLDGQHFWRCDGCGRHLSTRRPFALSVVYLLVCVGAILLISGLGVLGAYLAWTQPPADTPPLRLLLGGLAMLGVGLIGGPIGVGIVLKDLLRPRPRKIPKGG